LCLRGLQLYYRLPYLLIFGEGIAYETFFYNRGYFLFVSIGACGVPNGQLDPSAATLVEQAFVVLMHAFQREGVRNKVIDPPTTIETVQVTALDHMTQIGTITVQWKDIMAFTTGNITGYQLTSRVYNP